MTHGEWAGTRLPTEISAASEPKRDKRKREREKERQRERERGKLT
jgi:hypothetical protein